MIWEDPPLQLLKTETTLWNSYAKTGCRLMEMDLKELQEIVSICLDEIVRLKQENESLTQRVNELSETNRDIINTEKVLIDRVGQAFSNIDMLRHVTNCELDNLKYELNDPKLNKQNWYYPKFYELSETLDMLIRERKSMARFGDGEFAVMSNINRHKHQRPDDKLAERLKEVIGSKEDNLLIGIADNYGALDKYNEAGKQGIRSYMTDEVRLQHRNYLDMNRKYHNAYISRPYALYADNNTDAPGKRFRELKKIWDKRNVIIVEGLLSRLGVGNDLFDNVLSVRRIEAPPINSFDKYDEILKASLEHANQDDLFLIALGPTAGVLAYDLTMEAYQAIDIGHIDLEYEWFLKGTGGRCEIKNKYNNEMAGGDKVEDIVDEKYSNEIICIIN